MIEDDRTPLLHSPTCRTTGLADDSFHHRAAQKLRLETFFGHIFLAAHSHVAAGLEISQCTSIDEELASGELGPMPAVCIAALNGGME